MRIFTAIATLILLNFSACGNEEEVKAAQAKVDSLQKENTALKARAAELEGRFAKVTAERDDLKSQLEKAAAAAQAHPVAPPPPVAAKKPAKGHKK